MKKTLFFTAALFFAAFSHAQLMSKPSDYPMDELDPKIKTEGEIKLVKSWDDNNGANFFVVSRSADYEKYDKETEQNAQNADLFVYHYILNEEGNYSLKRKITDFIKACPLDLKLDFQDESLTITDLDKDGYAEITFVYRMACRGDVSGSDQKLMLLEDGEKYAIRGTCNTQLGDEFFKGSMTMGDEFKKAPKSLQEHAKKMWKKFETEKF
jgi:hypothetical protein